MLVCRWVKNPLHGGGMTLGERLRQLRKTSGLSVEELARRSGLSAVAIYDAERGVRCPPLQSLRRLTDALGVSLAAVEGCELPADGRYRPAGRAS
jgi:transcriptional regulator with XRE-family HTH domain